MTATTTAARGGHGRTRSSDGAAARSRPRHPPLLSATIVAPPLRVVDMTHQRTSVLTMPPGGTTLGAGRARAAPVVRLPRACLRHGPPRCLRCPSLRLGPRAMHTRTTLWFLSSTWSTRSSPPPPRADPRAAAVDKVAAATVDKPLSFTDHAGAGSGIDDGIDMGSALPLPTTLLDRPPLTPCSLAR